MSSKIAHLLLLKFYKIKTDYLSSFLFFNLPQISFSIFSAFLSITIFLKISKNINIHCLKLIEKIYFKSELMENVLFFFFFLKDFAMKLILPFPSKNQHFYKNILHRLFYFLFFIKIFIVKITINILIIKISLLMNMQFYKFIWFVLKNYSPKYWCTFGWTFILLGSNSSMKRPSRVLARERAT